MTWVAEAYSAAIILIEYHGSAAANYAGRRAEQLLENGDPEGALAWHHILGAIVELQRGRREGEGLN